VIRRSELHKGDVEQPVPRPSPQQSIKEYFTIERTHASL
jgi:hypothetical protein